MTAQRFERAGGDTLPYRLFTPERKEDGKLPLVLFFHGSGERGTDNVAQLKHAVGDFIAGQRERPCFVVAPQCPPGRWWLPEELIALTEAMVAMPGVDPERVYVSGLSMGGYATWHVAGRRPDLFAAALPVCGGGEEDAAPRLATLPIWAFHGDADTIVKPEKSRAMIAAIKAAGGAPRYTEYPGVKHDAWTRTFANREVHEWLFAQRRGAAEAAARKDAPRPNIVMVLVDDLGYGDLGCYGQTKLTTPSIDRIAAEGRRYGQFYAGSTVCAPSRCVLMTAKHTGRCVIRGNARQPLPAEEVTVAEVLGGAGYHCALYGKWGNGEAGTSGAPTRQGFDEFYGYLNQRHAHNYFPTFLVRGEEREPLDNVVPKENKTGAGVATVRRDYSHDRIVDGAFDYIRRRAATEDPFFLYLALTIPHANNEAGKKGMEVPDVGRFAKEDWPEPERGFARMLEILDNDVGRLLDLLDELGIAKDTLVVFTSDNGPHREGGHDPDYFESRGPLTGIKRSLHEGGIRVPMIARWPGQVPPGSESAWVGAFQDMLPTFAALAGAPLPPAIAAEGSIDGVSFADELTGGAAPMLERDLYWAFYERGGARAVLMSGHWKAIEQPIGSPVRLYDLSEDLAERHDLATAHPGMVEDARRRMDAAYQPSERWKFTPRRKR